MNEEENNKPLNKPGPPHAAANGLNEKPKPLFKEPEPMTTKKGIIGVFETLLKSPHQIVYELDQGERKKVMFSMFILSLLSFGFYGLIAGLFSGGTQLWAAPAKIAFGSIASGLICLPSLYIFLCLSGKNYSLGATTGLLFGLLCLTGILLIGFAPVAWVFSASTNSIYLISFLHILFWVIAIFFGVRFLTSGLKTATESSSEFVAVWVIIYILVSFQMTATLRPIIGTADDFLPTEKKFFLEHWSSAHQVKSQGEIKGRKE